MKIRARTPLVVLVLAALACSTGACGGDGKGKGDGSGGGTGGRSRATKDRGTSSMQLGERAWIGTSARARIGEGNVLRISTSRSDTVDGKRRRESLTIVLRDYKGVGKYTASPMGSNFVGVSLDVGGATGAKTDEAVANEVTKALTGSQVLLLTGMTVEITSADDTAIEGTFQHMPPAGSKQPPIRDGRFRALVKD